IPAQPYIQIPYAPPLLSCPGLAGDVSSGATSIIEQGGKKWGGRYGWDTGSQDTNIDGAAITTRNGVLATIA
ncbi:MAG: hypothetical protein ABI865_07885, partial [Nitrosospira sp.]